MLDKRLSNQMALLESTNINIPSTLIKRGKSEKNDAASRLRMRESKEMVFKGIFLISSLLSVVVVILISAFIFKEGLPFFKSVSVPEFLFNTRWKPSSDNPSYGVLSFVVASAEVTLLSLIFALPISLLSAIYLSMYAKDRSANVIRSTVELLQSIPSVIYGILGIAIVVPVVRRQFGGNGYSLLSASIVLSIMIMPTIINVSESSIRAVGEDIKLGSIALGANDFQTITRVVLPSAFKGIMTSIILALGRAIGETTAVLLVFGNAPLFPKGLTSMGRTLTMNIVTDMSYAEGVHMNALFASSMLLFISILILNFIVVALTHKGRKR